MQQPKEQTVRLINSVAPARICDLGGWTDTWFAGYGKVLNIGVLPGAEVQLQVYAGHERRDRLVINAEDFGQRYARDPGKPAWDYHPLLEAAIQFAGVPDDVAIEVSVHSDVPAGASTGTSAAIVVALLGALDWLNSRRRRTRSVARAAHRVETDILHQQSGIQDQLCSACGGVCAIDIPRYPRAVVSPVRLPNTTWWELERRLVLIYLGRPHISSQVHEQVIRSLKKAGPAAPQLDALRATAEPARAALLAADLDAFGRAMIANTEAQQALHPDLVGARAQRVMAIAQAHGAAGWKVNGAGGEGGSVTVLCGPLSAAKRSMIREIEQENPLFRNIPIHLSRSGLRVWESSS